MTDIPSPAMARATEALERAEGAHQQIETHEKICADRYTTINDKIGLVLNVLGWGGGVLILTLISLVGALAMMLWNANSASEHERTMMLERSIGRPAIAASPGYPDGQ
jgi:hypothetical protein